MDSYRKAEENGGPETAEKSNRCPIKIKAGYPQVSTFFRCNPQSRLLFPKIHETSIPKIPE